MNTLGIVLTVLFAMVTVCGNRRWALLGIMCAVLYLTQQQEVQILGFHLTAIRLVELAGIIRVLARRELAFGKLNQIDRTMLLLYSYTTVVFLLRSKQGQTYVIGQAVDAFLCYFTFKALLVNEGDFKWFLRAVVVLLIPYCSLLLLETVAAHVPFRVLGAEDIGWNRGGRPRCIGSFRNPTVLGTLGASFLPLYAGMWLARKDQKSPLIGVTLCLFIVWASNSGGSISSVAVGMVGWLCWSLRRKMHFLRRSVAAGIVLLALVMNAPVWYFLSKVSSISGGDGYHRSRLLDMAFQNLNQWWLAGMEAEKTADWFPYVLAITGAADMCNYYLGFGMTAGLPSMILFLFLVKCAFSALGKALFLARSGVAASIENEYLLWGLGVMFLVHLVNWLGITYFDQTQVYYYLQFAIISNFSEACIRGSEVQVGGDARSEVARTPETGLAAGNNSA